MAIPDVRYSEATNSLIGNALLDERRLSFALRSGAGILFAIAFLWPAIGDAALVRVFAAYAFLDGILILSAGGWSRRSRCVWPLLLGGCADVMAGVAAYAWPGMTLLGLVNLMAIWAIVLGIGFAAGWAALRQTDGNYLLLSGIAAGLFGRALLSYTGGDVVVIATWTGLYALTLGILLFKLSLQLYRFVPVEVSAQRGGLFAFRASARSRRHRAR
jgi:uncharacterized membrane protein HdeD (DUF308 family)